jgi:LmbE family N-acetylglucosaminyl deacetylase
MATLVFFHAHPDDEAIGTGGTIAKASALGHRVVVVVATGGELGEQPEGLLRPGESLAERRHAETLEAARILGVERVAFLGYRDSGMMGAASNDEPGSFWAAEIDVAAQKLADIVGNENADLLAVYDETGITGHPDHVKVHQVGRRAAALAGTRHVVEGTFSRSQGAALIRQALAAGAVAADAQRSLNVELDQFGTPDELVTDRVDVRAYLDVKRRAMAAHASQISETSLFLSMPPETFEEIWGEECVICREDPDFSFERMLGVAHSS